MTQRPAEGPAPEAVLDRVVAVVLGGPPELTRDQASAAAGLTVEQARPYWRAMGFADVGEERVFTHRDVEALRVVAEWARSGVLDEARIMEIVRGLGQTASRLADWQVGTIAKVLAEAGEDGPIDNDALVDGIARVLPEVESLLVHAWRRHLAADMGRGLATVDEAAEATDLPVASVGFADITGFTRLAREMGEEDLAAMVTGFEHGCADVVAKHGGRLVKTLGDEVMFVTEDPDTAVAIAAAMHGLPHEAEPLRLRIGLATGRVITLMGDYYGETVNRASRLTAIAKPGVTLMDPATEEALAHPDAYVVRHLRPRALRGLGLVRTASVVPRAGTEG
ncbi:MAG TPA: adenylate/guanylate cyclase domain-containing protein [Candidatus Nanopelagicales bacterium]